jgi:hypothetical protein
LRIVTDRPSVELPPPGDDRDRLARRLNLPGGDELHAELGRVMAGVRLAYDSATTRERK